MRRRPATRRRAAVSTSVVVAVAAAVAATALAGCGPGRAGGSPGDERGITVLAASSLQPVLRHVARLAPGMDVAVSFAGSARLAAQVRAGVPADVVLTADERALEGLRRAGLVDGPVVAFAANRMAIAVPAANPAGIRSLADLGRPGVDVVLAAPVVPAGRHAAAVLRSAGVSVAPVSFEDSVAAVAARVARGEADAGIVYATDVRARPALAAVAIPAGDDTVARYAGAMVASTRSPAAARRFVAHLRSPGAQARLRAAGFLAP